jgi:hypothetical protein
LVLGPLAGINGNAAREALEGINDERVADALEDAIREALGRNQTAVSQATSDDSQSNTQTAIQDALQHLTQADRVELKKSQENPFDLAFGVSEYVAKFAASFAQRGQRRALWYWYWPDWLIRGKDGRLLPIASQEGLRGNLHFILNVYFAGIPDGRLKFNLAGMDSSKPNSVTSYELDTILRLYRARVDFYLFDETSTEPIELRGAALETRLAQIRGS